MVWRWNWWRARLWSDSPHTSTPLSRKLKWKSGPWMSADPIVPRMQSDDVWYLLRRPVPHAASFWTTTGQVSSCETLQARLNEVHQTEYDDSSVKSEWIYKCIMDSWRSRWMSPGSKLIAVYKLRNVINAWGSIAMMRKAIKAHA